MEFELTYPVFKLVAEASRELKQDVYVVGGYVRDQLLGKKSGDIDFVTVGSGIELAKLIGEKIGKDTKVHYYKNFGTAMISYKGEKNWVLEFVGARKESYRKDSRKPIVEEGSLDDDQKRRDFTINAMALSLQEESWGQLIDPFEGLNDLKNKTIKTPLEPGLTFTDDPLRMMRAIRFASQLEFEIESNTFNAIRENRNRIGIISKERISDEINKIILSREPSQGFMLLYKCGLLEIIFPEFVALKGADYVEGKGHKDNFYHTLKVLDNIALHTDNLWLRWAAILHDIAKPVTKKYDPDIGWTFHGHEFIGSKMVPGIFKRFKLPLGDAMKYVQKLVLLHLRPAALADDGITDSAIRRLLFEAGEYVEDLMTLCEADITSKNLKKIEKYISNFKIVREKLIEIEEKDRLRHWQPPIDGSTIMKTFDLKPSKEVGIIKTAIREAILDGIIHNDYDAAYKFMIEEGKKNGLKPVGEN